MNRYDYFAEQTLNPKMGRDLNLNFLDELIELMKKYKIDVPIVSIITGNEYHENIEYRKVLSKVKGHH